MDNHLAGVVVKASALRGADPGFNSGLKWEEFWVESYQ